MHLSIAIDVAVPAVEPQPTLARRPAEDYAGPLATFVAQLSVSYLSFSQGRAALQRTQGKAAVSYRTRALPTISTIACSV